ncbi:TIGR03364 family FAD-dependent oxidoreductase [Microbacterium sp. M28]|uniref:TIGR03364 family FAD-dependent oxidoreductase n=1 Tax=Microbacterium sp. M28 TaxID=2962064 RepID=UPI0021F44E0A|nr:TIGR03364 family FAD-dependent oxidoreductase [Microbacterium sp. M28]UYO97686.1 TIGR03364 family FAD-dependent oxidoreductase [Microbacterium sp. M28]
MSATVDLVVVGSGIVGLGAADAAARRGLRVIVVDRTAYPRGCDHPQFRAPLHRCANRHGEDFADAGREHWLRLSADAGFWLRASGTLVAAREDDELALLARAADDGGMRMLDAAEVQERAPLRRGAVTGGALIEPDLQTDPREAAAAIVRHLAARGVEFRFRTAVTAVRSGVVETTRGSIAADRIVVAVNHDVDQLLPELAERVGVERCALDMMRVAADLPAPLTAPLLTGWSLVRYGRFGVLPEAAALRARLHDERPDLAALDLNQMYTQLPDGSLILGDSHAKAVQPGPFQPELAFDVFLDEARALFAVDRLRVLERWQGVYATGPAEFLIEEPEPGVHVIAATTGIGMTCGFGLAEHTIHHAYDRASQPAQGGIS